MNGLSLLSWRRNNRPLAATGETSTGIFARIKEYLGYLAIIREMASYGAKFADAADVRAKVLVCLDALRALSARTATTLDDYLVASLDKIVEAGGLDLLLELLDHYGGALQSPGGAEQLMAGDLRSEAFLELRGRADRAGIDWQNLIRIAQWVVGAWTQFSGGSIPQIPLPRPSLQAPPAADAVIESPIDE
jgi:hypothetical protein